MQIANLLLMSATTNKPLKARLLEFRKSKKQAQQKDGLKTQQQPASSNGTFFNDGLKTNLPRNEQNTTAQNSKIPQTTQFQTEKPQPEPAAVPALEAPPWRCILDNFFTLDLLDYYPMRKWREFCAERPLLCWLFTGIFWAFGQFLAAKAQFGFVFLVLFLLLLVLLNLGTRKEGELSAYSVFNPGYEKLLGELTGEDFEREVLMRRTATKIT